MPPYRSSSGRPPARGSRDYRPPARPASPEAVEQVRGLIDYLAKSLVDDTERVRVRSISNGPGGMVFELSVAPDDMGRVIGKSGRTATALRTVLSALANGSHVRVDFLDVGER